MNSGVRADAPVHTRLFRFLPMIGVVIAITATTAMDASGLSNFSALALVPLMFLCWWLDRLSRAEMAFRCGSAAQYAVALLYPLIVIGLIASVAMCLGAADLSRTNWQKALLNLVIVTISTALIAIVTEEGFFRGWLWGSLRRRSIRDSHVLIYTSVAFAAWHISAVTLDTDYKTTAFQVPIFLINAAVIGAVWGMLRWLSGSIIVSSCSHAFWNGMAYVFFGFGSKTGALGITNSAIFSPETGVVGLVTNAIFALVLWNFCRVMMASSR
jgi:uncharacterized protein